MPRNAKIDDRADKKDAAVKANGAANGSAADATPKPDHNMVREGEFLQFVARDLDLKAQIKAIKEKQKKLRREMKDAGITLKIFDAMLALDQQEDEGAFEEEMAERLRYAQFLQLPMGTQTNFLEMLNVKTDPSPDVLKKARADGKHAGMRGKNPESPHELNTPEGQEWMAGWHEGQDVLKQELLARNAQITTHAI